VKSSLSFKDGSQAKETGQSSKDRERRRRGGLRATICYSLDFNEVGFSYAEEIIISINLFSIPAFHKGQAVYSTLMFFLQSSQGILISKYIDKVIKRTWYHQTTVK
jgi:hypothetical protein